MEKITLAQLKEMKPDTIFASGIGLIEHPWVNNAKLVEDGGTLEKDKRSTKVRWVAVRGGYHDWAIYHSLDANFIMANYLDDPIHLITDEWKIVSHGAKLRKEEDIKRFVPCTDEAFALYRN